MKRTKKHLLLLCIFLVNVVFFVQDGREPMDLGHYYHQLPDWIDFYQGHSRLSLLDLLTTSGAWLNAIWAGVISLGLVGKIAFACFCLFWLGVFLYNLRKFELLPLCFILMMPIWSIGTRTAWLHFIELSLFLVLWNVRKKTVLLFFVSILLVWLRPTSLVWFLMLVLFWSLLNDAKKIKALVGGGMIGLALVARELPSYFEGKMQVLRIERSLGYELMEQCFRVPLSLSILGCFLLFRYSQRTVEENFLWMSIFIALIVSLGFGVGTDNFLVLHFALGYLGGRGWLVFLKQKKWNKVGQELLSGLMLLITVLPLLPQKMVGWAKIPLHETVQKNDPWEVVRVQKQALTLKEVMPFLEQICSETWETENQTCQVVSSQGLFHPMREEDGQLAVILSGVERLRISNAGLWWTRQDLAAAEPLQGIVLFQCSTPDQGGDFFVKENKLRSIPSLFGTEKIGEVQAPNCPVEFFKMTENNLREKLRKMDLRPQK